ncbi:MAG TPA: tetraacyldisaccharide 4'-kinase [Deltaproteobacteria bacterium]|nr:tetraacyldisaccharide 4'-kinase [Deltaproteobacteria bacterium]
MVRLLSALYSLAIRTRNGLYDLGILRTYHTPPVVISVGNIEVGGTGKTPFTIALAGKLKENGHHVAILTRGYKGKMAGPLLVHTNSRVEDVGDEALLMARTAGVPVIKSPDRVKGAVFAHNELGARIVIMDDGFQHRRIYRDLDIVLVARDVHTDAPLPLGLLREPASSLKRAHLIVRTKGSTGTGLTAELAAQRLVDSRGTTYELETLRDKAVLAICGIASPGPFFSTLEDLGAKVETLSFPDHHRYSDRDISKIQDRAANKDLIVTTEKDLVRLRPEALDERWRALQVEMIVPEMNTIVEEIETVVKNRRVSRQG